MTRWALEAVLFFGAPFAAFATWLVVTRRPVMSKESWDGAGGWLTIAGLACVILLLVWVGLTAERGQGAYEPSRIENGRIAPGRIR
jgi:hypothetical protein